MERLVSIDVLEDGQYGHRVDGRYGRGEGEYWKYPQLWVVQSVEQLEAPGYQESRESRPGQGQHQDGPELAEEVLAVEIQGGVEDDGRDEEAVDHVMVNIEHMVTDNNM